MKTKAAAVLCASVALSGCVAQETFVKTNMRYSDFEQDRATCETKAAQEVEANRSPGAEIVVAVLTGIYATQDANAEARKRNYEACMISKGYQRVELPPCKNAKEARENGIGPLTASKRVVIESNSCAANDQLGRIVFYKQGATGEAES